MRLEKRARILILTGNSLCHNPRALKEAEALADEGHQVDVLGSGANQAYRLRDEKLAAEKKWKFIGLGNDAGRLERNIYRAQLVLS